MAYESVDKLFNEFRQRPDLVVINDLDAMGIYEFFMDHHVHPSNMNKPGAKAFLQAAMTGALDASNDAWMQAMASGIAIPSASAEQAISRILRVVGKRLLSRSYVNDPQIYVSIRDWIKLEQQHRFRSIVKSKDVI